MPPSDHNFHKYLNRPNNYSIYFDPVDTCDIIQITSKLKTKTSHDLNNLSTKILKTSIIPIAKPLTHIVNLSLTTGVVPLQMKIARLIPIFKSGERTLFNNYRPISMLPVFSKLLEKKCCKKTYVILRRDQPAIYIPIRI